MASARANYRAGRGRRAPARTSRRSLKTSRVAALAASASSRSTCFCLVANRAWASSAHRIRWKASSMRPSIRHIQALADSPLFEFPHHARKIDFPRSKRGPVHLDFEGVPEQRVRARVLQASTKLNLAAFVDDGVRQHVRGNADLPAQPGPAAHDLVDLVVLKIESGQQFLETLPGPPNTSDRRRQGRSGHQRADDGIGADQPEPDQRYQAAHQEHCASPNRSSRTTQPLWWVRGECCAHRWL